MSLILFDILESMLASVLLSSSHLSHILNFCNSWASHTQLFISPYNPAILCLPIGLTVSFSLFPLSLMAMFSLLISLISLNSSREKLFSLSRIKALPLSVPWNSHNVNLYSVQVRFFLFSESDSLSPDKHPPVF